MSDILRPGIAPPMIVPYCALCGQPCESFRMDVVKSPRTLGIHANCCGKTSSAYIPIEEVFRLKQTNEKYYVIVPPGRVQGLRAR